MHRIKLDCLVYLYDQSKLQIFTENKYNSALTKFLKQQKNKKF
jgi:hypothetical protein